MRELFAQRSWRRWTIASFLSRLPISMALLAFQLAGLYALESIASGAVLAGVTSFTAGFVGPMRGTWLDRREMRRGLQISCCAAGIVMGLFTIAVAVKAPFWVLLILALSLGVATGGIWGGFRALLLHSVPRLLLRKAHFVESLSTELGYGIGPLLVTGIAALAGVVVALTVMTITMIVAAFALMYVPTLEPTSFRGQRVSVLTGPLVFICVVGALLSFGFGIVESNVPSRMAEFGFDADAGGIFLAFLAMGSVVGGLVVSVFPITSKRPAILAAGLFALFALLIIPSALVPDSWMFGLCLLVVSLMLVPLSGLGAAEVEARIGVVGRGKIFALYLGAVQVGGGLGVTVNGVLLSFLEPDRIPFVTCLLYGVLAIVLLCVGLRSSGNVPELATIGVGTYEADCAPDEL